MLPSTSRTTLFQLPAANWEIRRKTAVVRAAAESGDVIDAEIAEASRLNRLLFTPILLSPYVYSEESTPEPPTEPMTQRIVVLGGNGFVGSAVCRAALQSGLRVTSVNRSGPPTTGEAWIGDVEWTSGDVFNEESWVNVLQGATAVVSCIGGFGSNADMERINGDATIAAIDSAATAMVPRFVFVAVHDYNIPAEFKNQIGYFDGKQRAEESVFSMYPEGGVVLKPGFIYGDRVVPELNNVTLPLGLAGEPLKELLKIELVKNITSKIADIPASDVLLVPPVSVDAVAAAAVQAAIDKGINGVLDVAAIEEFN
ncbi:hypothetical protein CYMTET_26773 [Cymbomonas tetramitiformis]|uniref:NAD(P)-binding domain-containing protein n=1 Tax=Cymbomonas tetramitiformis TaxID=36881 RepID=A0AAE0FR32_9CHLO|nr:hypothetical protein CYMTET_26773 [Cymbomonas tetramitiformis]